MSQPSRPSSSRRRALAGAGAVGALAAVAAVLPGAPTLPASADTPPQPRPAPPEGGGYQLSEHVQRYYQTARV